MTYANPGFHTATLNDAAHLRILLRICIKRLGEKQTFTSEDFGELGDDRLEQREDSGNLVLELANE